VCASVCVTCRVNEGYVGSEQLVRYFYSAPHLDVAYCLVAPNGAVIDNSPWLATPISFSIRRRG